MPDPDLKIRVGGGGEPSPKIFFRPLGPQFGLKIRWIIRGRILGKAQKLSVCHKLAKCYDNLKDKFQLTTPLVKEEILIYVFLVRTKDHILYTLEQSSVLKSHDKFSRHNDAIIYSQLLLLLLLLFFFIFFSAYNHNCKNWSEKVAENTVIWTWFVAVSMP